MDTSVIVLWQGIKLVSCLVHTHKSHLKESLHFSFTQDPHKIFYLTWSHSDSTSISYTHGYSPSLTPSWDGHNKLNPLYPDYTLSIQDTAQRWHGLSITLMIIMVHRAQMVPASFSSKLLLVHFIVSFQLDTLLPLLSLLFHPFVALAPTTPVFQFLCWQQSPDHKVKQLVNFLACSHLEPFL